MNKGMKSSIMDPGIFAQKVFRDLVSGEDEIVIIFAG